ncbi:MAG: hypothetical protein CBC48_04205 [bacterium TMED88]|nr:hypothetical protein [Deltaproteobacteria bacterium]OUV35264.1 MAG: hypothetical protein CBC48_04205 [bacterium TMED88]
MWSRTFRGLGAGAALPLVLSGLLGCGEALRPPLASVETRPDASEFIWVDDPASSSTAENDLAGCRARVMSDPWVLAQGELNQGIILVGCMEKKGWRWRSADLSGGAPSTQRRVSN